MAIQHMTRAQYESIFTKVLGEKIPNRPDQQIWEGSAIQNYVIDASKEIGECKYRYGLVGGANLALGVLCQAPIPEPLHHDLVPAASYAIGTVQVQLTIGAAGIAADEYAGGYLFVNDGTGQGQVKKILTHPAALTGATCVFTLVDPLTTALDTANSLCTITRNPYNQAIITTVPPGAKIVGVPVCALTLGTYGWFQVRGPAAVLTQGTLYLHRQVRPGTVAGSVAHAIQELITGGTAAAAIAGKSAAKPVDSAAVETVIGLIDTVASTTYNVGHLAVIVGRVMKVEVDTDYSLIDLTLE